MGSTYTTNGGIEKIGLGEQAGAWGTTTNNNFDIIDRLINGVGSVSLSSSAAAHDLTTSDGSLSDGMFRVLTFTNASEACTITIKDESSEKLYFVRNTSGQTLTFKQGSSGSTVNLLNNKGAIIFADGGGSTNGNVVDLTALFTTSQAIDNVVIGGTTPAAITGTTITATTSILPDAEGGADIGSTSAEFGDIYIADDKKIQFGSDQDVLMEFDADDTGTLLISNGDVTLADDKKLFFGTGKDVSFEYDEDGTDTVLLDRSSGAELITIADDKKIIFGTNKDVSLEYDEDGTDSLLVTGNVTFADGTTDVDIASHDTSNGLKLGGTLVTATAEEINKLDGVTSTTAELNHTDGVTSNIQTQLDTKHSAVGQGLKEDDATTVAMKNSWVNNTSSAISSSSTSSFTASTYPTFISARTNSAGNPSWTITIGGSATSHSTADGDSGTLDSIQFLLPVGGTLACTTSFSYFAFQIRPNS